MYLTIAVVHPSSDKIAIFHHVFLRQVLRKCLYCSKIKKGEVGKKNEELRFGAQPDEIEFKGLTYIFTPL